MKKAVLFWVAAVVITVMGASLLVGVPVYAVTCARPDGTTYETYFDWNCNYVDPNTGESSPILGVITLIMDFLAAGVGIIAVAGIIYGGIQYSLAMGDKAKVAQAIGIIKNCAIALVLAGLWGSIMWFVKR